MNLTPGDEKCLNQPSDSREPQEAADLRAQLQAATERAEKAESAHAELRDKIASWERSVVNALHGLPNVGRYVAQAEKDVEDMSAELKKSKEALANARNALLTSISSEEAGCRRSDYELEKQRADALAQQSAHWQAIAQRLAELMKVAVCPDQNCDGKGTSFHVEQSSQSGEAEQVPHQCQWCDERDSALAAFQQGKAQP